MKKKVPEFRTEDEEREFWAEADSTEYLDWKKGQKVVLSNLKPSLRTISLRLPESMIEELKLLANQRDVPYQSLMKVFLSERLKQELKAPQPRRDQDREGVPSLKVSNSTGLDTDYKLTAGRGHRAVDPTPEGGSWLPLRQHRFIEHELGRREGSWEVTFRFQDASGVETWKTVSVEHLPAEVLLVEVGGRFEVTVLYPGSQEIAVA